MDQVALVTGASSGVGEALAPLLAAAGWTVYGMSRRSVSLPGVIALPADVSDGTAVEEAIARLLRESGRLDALLHCAGIGGAGPVESMPADRARRIMDTNFWGSWNLCRACLPHLRKSPRGRILLVSSIAGHMGIPFRAAYCASKAAVNALSDSLRLELKGSPVTVSCISPGDIATNSIATQYRQPTEDLPEVYRARYRAADEGMAANVDHGMPASRVATEMLDILRAASPAPHYTIGEPVQRLSLVARRLLPARWWENILDRYYG